MACLVDVLRNAAGHSAQKLIYADHLFYHLISAGDQGIDQEPLFCLIEVKHAVSGIFAPVILPCISGMGSVFTVKCLDNGRRNKKHSV